MGWTVKGLPGTERKVTMDIGFARIIWPTRRGKIRNQELHDWYASRNIMGLIKGAGQAVTRRRAEMYKI